MVLPHKDLRIFFLQGDAQLTLADDMMITAANKNDRALQQLLLAALGHRNKVKMAKVEGPSSAFLAPVSDARS